MMHPAALIESGDWTKAGPDAALAAGRRHGLQANVINAALEYFLLDEQIQAYLAKPKHPPEKAGQLSRRLDNLHADLMKACDELLKLVPCDTRRPHASERKARRA